MPEEPYRIYSAESIGTAIRHYRLQAGLTQHELAERTGLTQGRISELEGGRTTEQVRQILRVLRALGVRFTLEQADW